MKLAELFIKCTSNNKECIFGQSDLHLHFRCRLSFQVVFQSGLNNIVPIWYDFIPLIQFQNYNLGSNDVLLRDHTIYVVLYKRETTFK